MNPDVVVIGGGIIGCSVAYCLTRVGARVTVLESGEVGSGTSSVKSGMLSAQGEANEPGPLLDLLLAGREQHKQLEEDLTEATGLSSGYVWAGTARMATTEAAFEALKQEYKWQREENLNAELLDREQTLEIEPHVSEDVVGALSFPEDGQINPPDMITALVAGITRSGSEVREFTRVTGFSTSGSRVTGVRTTGGEISAGTVVLATGASNDMLGAELGIHIPVFPVKGELLVIRTRPVPIRANVYDTDSLYLVPKNDGRVIVGASEQPHVYDRRPLLGSVAWLSRAAIALVPELASARFDSAWGGLRPGTPTGDPILGPAPGWEGLFLATGHFRNGVLLSALSGNAIASLFVGEVPSVNLDPFLPERMLDRPDLSDVD